MSTGRAGHVTNARTTRLGRTTGHAATDCTSHFWLPRPPWSASPPSPHAHSCTFGNQQPGMMQSSTHSPPRWYPSEPGAYDRSATIKETESWWPAAPVPKLVRRRSPLQSARPQSCRRARAWRSGSAAPRCPRRTARTAAPLLRRGTHVTLASRSRLARDGPRLPGGIVSRVRSLNWSGGESRQGATSRL